MKLTRVTRCIGVLIFYFCFCYSSAQQEPEYVEAQIIGRLTGIILYTGVILENSGACIPISVIRGNYF